MLLLHGFAPVCIDEKIFNQYSRRVLIEGVYERDKRENENKRTKEENIRLLTEGYLCICVSVKDRERDRDRDRERRREETG